MTTTLVQKQNALLKVFKIIINRSVSCKNEEEDIALKILANAKGNCNDISCQAHL